MYLGFPKVAYRRGLTLAALGLEELFSQLCCCVSFWFWRGIGFGFTYLCIYVRGLAKIFWLYINGYISGYIEPFPYQSLQSRTIGAKRVSVPKKSGTLDWFTNRIETRVLI
jgi:hypothetical protein